MAKSNETSRDVSKKSLDSREFAAQYQAIYSRLQTIAAAIVGDGVFAEDIVQDAALIASQRIDQFTPGTNFSAWMSEIVRRRALGTRRDKRNRKTYATDPADIAASAEQRSLTDDRWPISAKTGNLQADQSAFDDSVQSALLSLGKTARCCLLLQTVQRLSYAEIAVLMDIPEGTAMSHVHRAKAAMKQSLMNDSSSRADRSNSIEPHCSQGVDQTKRNDS